MKTSRRFRLMLVVLAVSAVPSVAARAELPPSAYEKRQKDAPEHVEIRVASVKTEEKKERGGVRIEVRAQAQVGRVHRSASGLKTGDAIRLRYTHTRPKEPIAGPSEVPIVRAGETCPAFLARDEKDGTYVPVAGGYSFQAVN